MGLYGTFDKDIMYFIQGGADNGKRRKGYSASRLQSGGDFR